MKYLKKFEELNNIEDIKTVKDVVNDYSTQYPEFSTFFIEFSKRYENNEAFKDELWKYLDEDDYDDEDDEDDEDDDEEETEDERFDRLWNPESEVYMLESIFGKKYPGDEIWVDFYNDMVSAWKFEETPLGKNTTKYNV